MSQADRPATPSAAAGCRSPIDDRLDAALFRALGDPTRVRLVACLAKCGRGCSVTEIAGCCPVDVSVISRHLALLERAGVLESTRQGRTVRYRVLYPRLSRALRELADAIDHCCPGDADDRCAPACCPPSAGRKETT